MKTKPFILFFILFVLFVEKNTEDAFAGHSQRLSVDIKEVTVRVDGVKLRGSGTVHIDPPDVICAKTTKKNCKQRYDTGTIVTLTAIPNTGSVFKEWGGTRCAGGDASKFVTLNKSLSCKAYFAPNITTTTTTTTTSTTGPTTSTSTTTTTATTIPSTTTTTTPTTTLPPPPPPMEGIPPPNFKIAFIGDQGLGSNAKKVLQLIKDEGAQMILLSGDFEYQDNPTAWENQINSVLGDTFPVFASIGNHEVKKWSGSNGYQQKLIDRISRMNTPTVQAVCTGDMGVAASCTYKWPSENKLYNYVSMMYNRFYDRTTFIC